MNEVLLSPIAEIPEAEAETVDSQTEEGQGKEEDKQRDGRGDKRRLEEEREEEEGEAFVTKVNQEGFLDFVKDPDMRFLTLTMLYIWWEFIADNDFVVDTFPDFPFFLSLSLLR